MFLPLRINRETASEQTLAFIFFEVIMEQTKEIQNNKFLGTEKVGKLLRMFAIPCVLSLVIQALYNIVDQIFIGQSGYLPYGNTATGIVYPLTVIVLAFGLFIGDGIAALMSINQGKNDTKSTHKAVGTGISVGLLVSLILMALSFIFQTPLLKFFGASGQGAMIFPDAKEYSFYIFLGFPFFLLACVLNPVIRADGSPKFAMFSMAIGAIVNIILDPIFIFVCHMGMNGAALATFIGQVVSFVFHACYFFRSRSFKLKLSSFLPDFRLLFSSLKLGISSFLTQASIVIISIVNNKLLIKYFFEAENAIGIFTVAFKIFGIVISIVIGIAAGGQPILGYNYGAKKYDRVKDTMKKILLSTAIVGAVATILFEACPQLLLGVFGYSKSGCSAAEYSLGLSAFRIYIGFIFLTCFIKVISIFFQAISMPVRAMLIALLRDVIFVVPLAYLLPLLTKDAFYWSAPISDVLTFVISAALLVDVFKKMESEKVLPEQKPQPAIAPSKKGIIITISREHGAGGREIGRRLAEKLGIPFYDKEITSLVAKESGLAQEYINEIEEKDSMLYSLYLSTEANQTAINAQEKVLKMIAEKGSCVIVGRAADQVLRDYNPYKVFVYAPLSKRKQRVMANYGDEENLALDNIEKADKRRAKFYENVTGKKWGSPENYNLMLDSSIGIEKSVNTLYCATKLF